MGDDMEIIREKVAASAVENLEREGSSGGIIGKAIHDGLLKGFRKVRDAARIRRLMKEDARRLAIHAKDLRDWDVGDDHATAFEVQEISERLASHYGLKIGASNG